MSLNLWRCRGTESLLKQELKPGGHGSACSVNSSGWFLTETCWGTLAPPLQVPPQFKHHLHLVSAGKHGKSFTDTNNCRPVTTPVKPSYFTCSSQPLERKLYHLKGCVACSVICRFSQYESKTEVLGLTSEEYVSSEALCCPLLVALQFPFTSLCRFPSGTEQTGLISPVAVTHRSLAWSAENYCSIIIDCNPSGPPHFIVQRYILLPSLYTFVKKVQSRV
ncbi:hypothetical protein GOODEAATRI_000628 [Goodea atripinnis]|uniref:Uncharacterized protein n=1 Tax=Goodea atripinnis TaxID=208336 RepID=A0ABV0P0B5_9TELE